MEAAKELVYSRYGDVFNTPEEEKGEFEGEPCYYVGEKEDILPGELVFRVADTLTEMMEEQLYERVGEAAEDSLTLSEESKQELENIIRDFMNEHAKISCYAVHNVRKIENGVIQNEAD